eukprot:3072157-Rhodomonas_salina.1
MYQHSCSSFAHGVISATSARGPGRGGSEPEGRRSLPVARDALGQLPVARWSSHHASSQPKPRRDRSTLSPHERAFSHRFAPFGAETRSSIRVGQYRPLLHALPVGQYRAVRSTRVGR